MNSETLALNLSGIARRMALFLACVLLFEVLSIALCPRLHSGSVLKIARDSLVFRLRNDSWLYMAEAQSAMQQHPRALYESTFFGHNVRFIYPPVSLLLYRGCLAARRLHVQPFTALKLMLVLAMVGAWAAAAAFFFRRLPVEVLSRARGRERVLIRAMIAVLIVTFLPLINALFLGQVQTILNFFLIGAVLLWLDGRRVAAGVLLGLGCWLKPTMALFLLWGMLRRQWSFVASLAAMLLIGVGLSLAVFGPHNTQEYLAVLRFLGHRGDALFTNQSLNGLLHRELHIGSPVTWVYGYPPYNRAIDLATEISSAVLLLMALACPPWRRLPAEMDFLVFAMAATMASPIAWEHHYGAFFLVFLAWMPEASQRWVVFLALLAAYLLMTDNWAPVTLLMNTPWTFLISHIYLGGLLLFGMTLFGWPSNPIQAQKRA